MLMGADMPAAVKSSGLRTQISSSWSGVGIGKNLMEEQCSQMVFIKGWEFECSWWQRERNVRYKQKGTG